MIDKSKQVLTFLEVMEMFNKLKPKEFLIWGIKAGSMGLLFGPSKSGKTILLELLALCIAVGKKKFLDQIMNILPQKILFLGLEEFWESRAERNLKQYNSLTEPEKKMYEQNYLYQSVDFVRFISKKEDWNTLKKLIKDSGAKYVFIDSITRMNHGNLEDGRIAQEIMQRLRDMCYDLKITLICIHHTPKMNGNPLTMDSIKGSSVFAQESDFAIGVNRANNRRYIKDIFYRYKADDSEKVTEFTIDENVCVQYVNKVDEYDILSGGDRRKSNDKRDLFFKFFKENPCREYKTLEIVKHFTMKASIKERQVKNYLRELTANKTLLNPKKGIYIYSGCESVRKEAIDEEE